jgi:hypothetical protein
MDPRAAAGLGQTLTLAAAQPRVRLQGDAEHAPAWVAALVGAPRRARGVSVLTSCRREPRPWSTCWASHMIQRSRRTRRVPAGEVRVGECDHPHRCAVRPSTSAWRSCCRSNQPEPASLTGGCSARPTAPCLPNRHDCQVSRTTPPRPWMGSRRTTATRSWSRAGNRKHQRQNQLGKRGERHGNGKNIYLLQKKYAGLFVKRIVLRVFRTATLY